ncbi:hypothetical protein PCANC_08754 [Puccinia coronata f. sp. avenae]|uniref:Uncharacterized protein n=1 Tax=Puccinia coronata f. sp. avenae TaxID=200324 RepID=A0A2N5T1V1_9BASI|nr:hypothetical protein PCANC_08754 [Puccinia coronata f. sp. avenae]
MAGADLWRAKLPKVAAEGGIGPPPPSLAASVAAPLEDNYTLRAAKVRSRSRDGSSVGDALKSWTSQMTTATVEIQAFWLPTYIGNGSFPVLVAYGHNSFKSSCAIGGPCTGQPPYIDFRRPGHRPHIFCSKGRAAATRSAIKPAAFCYHRLSIISSSLDSKGNLTPKLLVLLFFIIITLFAFMKAISVLSIVAACTAHPLNGVTTIEPANQSYQSLFTQIHSLHVNIAARGVDA